MPYTYQLYLHIDIANGEITGCRSSPGRCPLGTDNQHFNSYEGAREARDAKLLEFKLWTENSVDPQLPGCFTEYVFDPSRSDTMGDYGTLVGWGTDLADGTRLVIENGWVLEVEPGGGKSGAWTLVSLGNSGDDEDIFSIGDFHDEVSLWRNVKKYGARLEVPENVTPIRIKWRPEVGGY